jgi:predicted amidohydrolase
MLGFFSGMKRKIKVAAVQMYIEPENIRANLKKASDLMAKIFRKSHCDLVVFPEDHITGPIPYRLDLAQDEKSKSIQFFRDLALKYKTHIVCGSYIRKIGKKYFNKSILIDDKGRVVLEYLKNHLWIPERKYLTAGKGLRVVHTSIGKIGIIICWDLVFPEACRELARQGAEIICCPSYWTDADGGALVKRYGKPTERRLVGVLCEARAMENEVLLVYANGAGVARIPLKTKIWQAPQIGQTQICAPVLGAVVKMNDNSEGFVIHEYDRYLAKEAERTYRIRGDLKRKSV